MPRRSVLEARHTRESILRAALDIASLDGLEGVTIGRLATELTMSKSGVLGHFGTKQALQLAVIEWAIRDYLAHVVHPALREPRGRQRLLALCDNWFDYLCDTGLPGGCLLTAAALEFDGRAGDVRDLVVYVWQRWHAMLRAELTDVPDPEQALFEIAAMGPALNQAIQLYGDHGAAARAKRAVRRIITAPQPDPLEHRQTEA